MSNFLRQFYRFCIQANYEGWRYHKAVLNILHNVSKVDNMLDIGCGEGTKTIQYAKMLSVSLERVYGIEINPEYVKSAQEHFKIIDVNLEHDTFPFQDQEIEVIICNQILEHLKNIFLPLSEMDRVLKIGGHLIIGIPNLAALHNRFFILFGKQPSCNVIMGPHIRCFTHKGFLKFIRQNTNFKLQSTSAATLYPFPYPIVEYCAKYFPGFASYTFYLLKKIKHNPDNCGWSMRTDFDTCY
ncbi:MAG: class I SAM-dependent methyltransferase [Candidatus Scalindua sp.]